MTNIDHSDTSTPGVGVSGGGGAGADLGSEG
jgi:hypothetical protein